MSTFLSKLSTKVGSKLGIDTAVDPLATKTRDDGLITAKGWDALFTRTQAAIDGEECLHDCQTCTVNLPRKWSIDEEDKLYGFIKGWSRHILVATGKSDWVRDVEDEKGSVMEAVGKHIDMVQGGRLMLSASNIPLPDHAADDSPYGADRPTSILLLPAFQWVEQVTPNSVPDFMTSILNTATTNETLIKQSPKIAHAPPSSKFVVRSCQHKHVILLCSQGTRDARCGQSAPLLKRELERHLRPLGMYRDQDDDRPGGVGIYFISHVGGHKYSANMMVYRRADVAGEAVQCIWLARIRPEDCENIVRYTVLEGKVVKPERQLRGGFDREKGVVSW